MRRLLPPTMMLMLAGIAQAQEIEPPVGDEVEQRRYAVEVIIFRYAEDMSVGTEQFPPDEPPEPDPFLPGVSAENGVLVFGDEAFLATEPEPDPVEPEIPVDEAVVDDGPLEEDPRLFVLLGGEDLTLNETYDMLERRDAYEPLHYFGWMQSMLPEGDKQVIDLEELVDVAPGLEGSLTLYLSRYLHLVVDLELERASPYADPVAVERPELVFGDERLSFDADADDKAGKVFYRIDEDRIFKNGDVRYYDHPKFGVIAKVTRIEEDAEADEAEGLAGDDAQTVTAN